jgi:hypothetical protein
LQQKDLSLSSTNTVDLNEEYVVEDEELNEQLAELEARYQELDEISDALLDRYRERSTGSYLNAAKKARPPYTNSRQYSPETVKKAENTMRKRTHGDKLSDARLKRTNPELHYRYEMGRQGTQKAAADRSRRDDENERIRRGGMKRVEKRYGPGGDLEGNSRYDPGPGDG